MYENEEKINELENKIHDLECKLKDTKNSYRAKFTALIFAANTHDAVSSDWVKGAIDHLLKEDDEWWGHKVKGELKGE